MIKHVVMWTVKGESHGMSRPQIAEKIKRDLEALPAEIPELQHIEVGINQAPSEASCDVCLISEFETWADLDTYRDHPAHQDVVAFVKEVVTGRHVVDYEG